MSSAPFFRVTIGITTIKRDNIWWITYITSSPLYKHMIVSYIEYPVVSESTLYWELVTLLPNWSSFMLCSMHQTIPLHRPTTTSVWVKETTYTLSIKSWFENFCNEKKKNVQPILTSQNHQHFLTISFCKGPTYVSFWVSKKKLRMTK